MLRVKRNILEQLGSIFIARLLLMMTTVTHLWVFLHLRSKYDVFFLLQNYVDLPKDSFYKLQTYYELFHEFLRKTHFHVFGRIRSTY